jgi:predicted MPP superfamily phosphohydrolase
MVTILHLSDLHFTIDAAGTQFDRDAKIRAALLEDLGKEDRKNFDAIVVTGDIAYHGRTEEFQRAKAWLEEVRVATGCPPEAVFVVPGNHDVNQAKVPKDSSLWDLHQALRAKMPSEERFHRLDKKLQDAFDFLTAMAEYRAFAVEYGCLSNPKEVAWVQVLATRPLEDGTPVRLHGLNTALLSDEADDKANLLLGACQFHHFSRDPNYISVVLCHHPHTWLIDGDEANDYFRHQTQIVLSGHDHTSRCYPIGSSLRVFAGAIHPNRREAFWEPSYNVLRLSMSMAGQRTLVASVEGRIWLDRDKCFAPAPKSNGERYHEFRFPLEPRTKPVPAVSNSSSMPEQSAILSKPENTVTGQSNDALVAARRKLIVHFFRLGTIDRYQAVIDAGVWEEGDDAFDGQERWARVFERAEKAKMLGVLWAVVSQKDQTLAGQANPFSAGK